FRPRAEPAPAPQRPPAAPAPAPAAAQPGQERPLSPMRKAIARRLTESKQTIPHFYLTTDLDVEALVALRAQFNAAQPEEQKLSFNDLMVKACAIALERVPQVNIQLAGEAIRAHAGVHIGVAVAMEEGLIVPVVRDCQTKSVSRIAGE